MRGDRLRRGLAVAGVGGVLLLIGPAAAQDGRDPFAAFGGLDAASRAGGVQVSYDVEGVLPLPPPLLEVTVPSARTTTATGPASIAAASLAYPGDLIGNLPALVEQTSPGSGSSVPPYPLIAIADHPSGPTSARQDLALGSAVAGADETGARATTTMAATEVPGVVQLGAVTTTSRTGMEDGKVVARARAEVARASLLFGLVVLEDVVTDVVAVSDGTAGRADGTTTVGRITVLGQEATLGPDGLVIGTPVLPDLLGPIAGGLDELLAAAGLHLAIAPVEAVGDGAAGQAVAAGLEVVLDFDGSGDNPLAQLLALLPSDALPGEGLPGVPLNTSPQALVNLLKETHVVRVAFAPARVVAEATPLARGADGSEVPSTGPSVPGPSPTVGFTTPLPDLVEVPGAPVLVRSGGGGEVPGRAIGVAIVLLAVLTVPAWGLAGRRLMDLALADPAPGCVDGWDGSHDPTRTGGTRG